LDRVKREVPQQLQHVAVGFDQTAVVPLTEEMSDPAMASVEPLCIAAVQAVHTVLQSIFGNVEQ
jgi:hypothetical protein